VSYILDALRKSEEERQRGIVPDVLTVQRAATKAAEKRRFLSFFLLAVLLFNACVVAWWLSPWQPAKREAVREKNKVAGSETMAVSPATNTKVVAQGGPAPLPHPVQRKEVSGGTSSSAGKEKASETLALMPQTTAKQPVSDPQGGGQGGDKERKLPTLKELPSSVQEGLPELSISLHYYASNPASRIVSVNDRTMREGEELTVGLKLEEITQDGAIFSYRGYRFHIGLK